MRIYLFAGADFSLFRTPSSPEAGLPEPLPETKAKSLVTPITDHSGVANALPAPIGSKPGSMTDPANVVLFQALLRNCLH